MRCADSRCPAWSAFSPGPGTTSRGLRPRSTAKRRYAGQITIYIGGRPLRRSAPSIRFRSSPCRSVIEIIPGEPFYFGTVNAAPLAAGRVAQGYRPGSGQARRLRRDRGRRSRDQRGLAAARPSAGHGDAGQHHRQSPHAHPRRVARRASRPGRRFRPRRGCRHRPGQSELSWPDAPESSRATLYSSDVTQRAEKRLRDLGVFESVRVDHRRPPRSRTAPSRSRSRSASGSGTSSASAGTIPTPRASAPTSTGWTATCSAAPNSFACPPRSRSVFEGAFDEPDYRLDGDLPEAGGDRPDDRLHAPRRDLPRDDGRLSGDGQRIRDGPRPGLLQFAHRRTRISRSSSRISITRSSGRTTT